MYELPRGSGDDIAPFHCVVRDNYGGRARGRIKQEKENEPRRRLVRRMCVHGFIIPNRPPLR